MNTEINITEERYIELEQMAKYIAVNGVRNNTELEDLHAGMVPCSKTGDYSDVYVVSPYGKIEWNKLSRFNDEEMRSLMLSIERAILRVLWTFEVLKDMGKEEEIKSLLDNIEMHRSYDRSNPYHKKCE
jgi:hypothetical protein